MRAAGRMGLLAAALAGCPGDAPAVDETGAGETGSATTSGETGAPTSGGEVSSSGASTGGASTGGASTGGASTGEASTGEASTGEASTGEASTSTGGEASTGEPPDCGPFPPCEACTCTDDGWSCDCPALQPEAGYLEIEPVSFVMGVQGNEQARTSDPARIFYSFRPADDPNAGGPLFVHFNGGPGVSTGILMAFGTGPVRIDDPQAVANPASWTELGDLLYIDARGTGFSYLRSAESADISARLAAFDVQNFNMFLDAADFVRVLLRFMAAHPALLRREVVIVGESYGGTRATLLLNMLLFREAYAAGGEGRYHDPALVAEIDAFLALRDPDVDAWTPALIAAQFGRQVLIQPGLGDGQRAVAGELLDLPDSPIFTLAAEVGLQFVPCSMKGPNCSPYENAISFVENSALRSRYDLAAGSTWLADSFAVTKARLSDLELLAAVLAVPPDSVAWLLPPARADAFRMGASNNYPADGGTIGQLGALAAWDRYYLSFVAEANASFRSPLANGIGVGAGDPHILRLMLHNLVYVDTFITAAARDVAIYAPSIPPTLAKYGEVASVIVGDGEFTVEFDGAPYPEAPAPGARTVRFPPYDSSHSVAVDQNPSLRGDVVAWLAGG